MLQATHMKDLKKSGLSDATIQKAGFYSVDKEELKKKLKKKNLRVKSAYAIPYKDGYERFRCFYASTNSKKPKYRQLKGTPALPYITDDIIAIREKNNIPLWITEGEKKALCLTQHGCHAIGVSGVWNFKAGKNSTSSLEDKYLWEEIRNINWKGRAVYLAFDADLWTNPQVRDALYELCFILLELKANIKIITWDISLGKGIDDYIVCWVKHREDIGKTISKLTKKAIRLTDFINIEHKESIIRGLQRVELSPINENSIVKKLSSKIGVKDQLIWDAISTKEDKKIEYSDDEVQDSLELLRSPNLLEMFLKDCHQQYIGRDNELILIKLATITRHFQVGVPIIITGTSSVGKSELLKTVLKTVDPTSKEDFTRVSRNYLLYKAELEHRIITLFEIHGSEDSAYLFRTALSEGELSLGTVEDDIQKGGNKPKDIKKSTKGLVLFSTFASASLDHELATRVILLELEHDPVLAKQVYQLNANTSIINDKDEISKKWQIADTLIKPKEVHIPYIKKLADLFPTDEERFMRDYKKVKYLICASALLHQYQRENNEGVIIASEEDYRLIYSLRDLLQQNSSEIAAPTIKFLRTIEKLTKDKEAPYNTTTRGKIKAELGMSDSSIKRYVKNAKEAECITVVGIGEKQTIRLVDMPKAKSPLPSPEELFDRPNEPLSQTTKSTSKTRLSDDQPQKSHIEPAQPRPKKLKLRHLTKKKRLRKTSSTAQ